MSLSVMDRALDRPAWWRRYWLYGIVGGVVLVGVISLILDARQGVYRVSADQLTIGTVTSGPFNDFAAVSATVTPFKTIYLTTDRGGIVRKILVEDGETVSKGQPLVELSNLDLELQMDSRYAETAAQLSNLQDAQLHSDQAQLEYKQNVLDTEFQIKRLKSTIDRDKRLLAADALASAVYEQDMMQYRYQLEKRVALASSHAAQEATRKEQLAQNQEALNRLNLNLVSIQASLDALTIRAPMAGQLTALDAEVGQSKAAGAMIGQVDSLDRYKLTAAVDEFYLGRVRVGQEAFAAVGDMNLAAHVSKIYPQVKDGTFKMDLTFAGTPPKGLRAGQEVAMKLELGGSKRAIMLPKGPFYQDTGGNWVYLLSDDRTHAKRRSVQLGRQNPDSVEVLKGLEPGDKVILSTYKDFRDADYIEIEGPGS